MGGKSKSIGLAVAFVGLMGLSAAASIPYLTRQQPPAVVEPQPVEVSTTEAIDEPAPAPRPAPKPKAAPRKRVTNWTGGGETTVVSAGKRSAGTASARGSSESKKGKKLYRVMYSYRDSQGRQGFYWQNEWR